MFGIEAVEHVEAARIEMAAAKPRKAFETGPFLSPLSLFCRMALPSRTMIGLSRPGVVNFMSRSRYFSMKGTGTKIGGFRQMERSNQGKRGYFGGGADQDRTDDLVR